MRRTRNLFAVIALALFAVGITLAVAACDQKPTEPAVDQQQVAPDSAVLVNLTPQDMKATACGCASQDGMYRYCQAEGDLYGYCIIETYCTTGSDGIRNIQVRTWCDFDGDGFWDCWYCN